MGERNRTTSQRLAHCVKEYREFVVEVLHNPIARLGYPETPEVVKLLAQLMSLLANINAVGSGERDGIESSWLPLIKRALLAVRRRRAAKRDQQIDHVHDAALRQTLGESVEQMKEHLELPEIMAVKPLRVPRLTDYFSLQLAQKMLGDAATLPAREYDEKFHILNAPTLFLPDLHYYRQQCELRGSAVAAAFVDIDNFKSFNTNHGHDKVDRNLLPRFMQALEAHVFGRGLAYREGGDEYLIVLPSAPLQTALQLLDDLRQLVSALSYPDISERTTVSVGLCVADADCFLTDSEVKERANRAAKFAKDKGKDRVVTYGGDSFADGELYIAAPAGGGAGA